MSLERIIEVESPTPLRYLIGATIMMIGVVLPVGYMMFRNKRVASSSSYSKLTNKGFMKWKRCSWSHPQIEPI